ncbi:MAG TPA: tRNA (adenosine(37)-N6)-threonylcarbamoyltransferase complex ATPase subunit type 1 TsaE [Gammaproteobacteria bacterium]|nr:tRNA (adenosine(37)-N6)-threonylcarbamoyltransferase complex ATPase subunit type 1 TsaE [Gammaproteobacteria bacterium]
MGQSNRVIDFRSESELVDFAGNAAARLRAARRWPLIVGLRGELGAGKTTWVRALLRGLGYGARVPSPTYTLLEHYSLGDLTVVHLDLYRLASEVELENLGLRDWLADEPTWVLVEWPDRAPALAARCDVQLLLEDLGGSARRLTAEALTPAGIRALQDSCEERLNYDR